MVITALIYFVFRCAELCDPALLDDTKVLLKCLEGIEGDVHSYKKHSRVLGKRSRPPTASSTIGSVPKRKNDAGGRKNISSAGVAAKSSAAASSTTTSSAPTVSASAVRFQAAAVKIPKKVLAERLRF